MRLLEDMRFSWRLLRRRPGFAFLIVGCLALGIGANAAMFSLLNALILRALPVPDAGRLLVLHRGVRAGFSLPDYKDVALRFNDSGSMLATLATESSLDRAGYQGQLVTAEAVSGNYARVFQMGTALGSWFDNEHEAVAVISYRVWQTFFDGDPRVLGQQVRSETQCYTVIGASHLLRERGQPTAGARSDTAKGDCHPLCTWREQKPHYRAIVSRQFLLAAAGGLGGLAVDVFTTRLMLRLVPVSPLGEGISPQVPLDWRVLAFIAACSVVSIFLFGLLPAWKASSPNLSTRITTLFSTVAGVRLRRSSAIAQVAVSFVLLVLAGLFFAICWRVERVDPGLTISNRLYATTYISRPEFTPEQIPAFYAQVLANLSSMPSVRSAALTYLLPLGATVTECAKTAGANSIEVTNSTIGAGFLRTMNIPLLRGRDFDNTDTASTQRVVLVNQLLAQQSYWQLRWESWLLGAFGIMALLLAALGLYGLFSYSTTLRAREFGLRMALGAKPHDVLWQVVKEGLTMGGIGVSIGLAISITLTPKVTGYLVTPQKPIRYVCFGIAIFWPSRLPHATCRLAGRRIWNRSKRCVTNKGQLLRFLLVIAPVVVRQNMVRIDYDRIDLFPAGRSVRIARL
jgi:MacB-like periplasmic core domain